MKNFIQDPVRLVSEPGYMQCHTYRLRGPAGCVLVDPGGGVQTGRILSSLSAEGLGLDDIVAVLFTHYHCDHALCAYWFREQGIPLMSSAHTADILARGDQQIWFEHPEMIRPCAVDRVLADGETLSLAGLDLAAVMTPGHTLGCMSFYLDTSGERVALTGDVLMPDGQPGWAGDEYSPNLMLESLVRLRTLALSRAYGGHGIVDERVDQWLAHGIELGRCGAWTPPTGYSSEAVPEELVAMFA